MNKHIKNIPYLAAGCVLSAVIIKPELVGDFFSIYNYAPFKCLVGFGLVYQGKNIYKYAKKLLKLILKPRRVHTVYGIPVHELADYLIEHKTFRNHRFDRRTELFMTLMG